MAALVAQKGLNPEAPEFIPKFAEPSSCAIISNHCLPPPNSSFYYPTPTPPYLHAFSTPVVFSQPLYTISNTTQPSLLIPQQHSLFPAPALLPVTESSLTVITAEQTEVEQKVVSEKVHQRAVKRGFRERWVWRRGGGSEGFRGHESEGKQTWKCKYGNGENQYFRKVEYKPMPKKKKDEVEPVQRDGQKTTVMIRNIPNKYTREMLLKYLDEHCMKENQKLELENSGEAEERILSAFDFLYLPMDFRTHSNKGYAFVNFTNPGAVWKIHRAAHNKKWELFHSNKIREIVMARIQGKEALVKHFESSSFACGSDQFLPVCFSPPRDGSGESVRQCTVGKRITTTPYREAHNHQI